MCWDVDGLLEDMVNQHCSTDGKNLDSMGLSANADAMRYLAEKKRITIIKEYGRRIIATWRSDETKIL